MAVKPQSKEESAEKTEGVCVCVRIFVLMVQIRLTHCVDEITIFLLSISSERPREPMVAMAKPQVRSREKKIIRVKKRVVAPQEETGGREEVVGEVGDSEIGEGRGEGGEEGEKKDEVLLTEKPTAPVTKRRKLARTPFSVAQTTPTAATPTITSSESKPKVTTVDSQLQPNVTKRDQTEPISTIEEPTDIVATENSLQTEAEGDQQPPVDEEVTAMEQEREGEERRADGQRKLSISEMKAQM